jgi:hypothetical protein
MSVSVVAIFEFGSSSAAAVGKTTVSRLPVVGGRRRGQSGPFGVQGWARLTGLELVEERETVDAGMRQIEASRPRDRRL